MASVAPAARKPAARPARPAALPATFQTKLEVGGANDHFEREADSVARRVVGGGSPASVPPTITPLGAQCKSMPKPEGKKKEEEKPKPKPTPKVQKKSAPPATKKKEEEKPKPAAKPIQKKAQRRAQRDGDGGAGTGGGMAPASVESSVGRMQSTGAPGLDTGTRSFMESRMGQDFGGVRVHKDSAANSAAQALNARAFTVGNDIFFNRGEYQPHSRAGRELIAHELTHTVQQSGGAARKIQRNGTGSEEDVTLEQGTELTSTRDSGRKILYQSRPGGKKGVVTLPRLALPRVPNALKGAASDAEGAPQPAQAHGEAVPQEGQPYNLTSEISGRENAIPTWLRYMRLSAQQTGIVAKLNDMADSSSEVADITDTGGTRVLFLKPRVGPSTPDRILIGTATELAQNEAIIRPNWGPNGRDASFDVDHILELQIGGLDGGENMWLLDSSFNRSSGSTIAADFQSALDDTVGDTALINRLPTNERPHSAADIRARWDIRFGTVSRHGRINGSSSPAWTRAQMRSGSHLNQMALMSESDLVSAGLRLRAGHNMTRVVVFPTRQGGNMVELPLDSSGSNIEMGRLPRDRDTGTPFIYEGIEIVSATFNRERALEENGDMVQLRVLLFPPGRRGKPPPVDRVEGNVSVRRDPRLGIAGYLTRDSIRRTSSRFPSASPVEFNDLDITPAGKLAGIGQIGATKPLFPGLPIELYLEGNDIGLRAPIPTDKLSLGPVTVTEASMGLGYGPAGLFVNGFAAFEIASLGTGTVEGRVEEGTAYLAGTFNMATDFLNPAMVGVRYDIPQDQLTISGHFGIQEGRIPGVAAADANLTISREEVDFNGTVSLAAPLDGVDLIIGYTQQEGLRIGAENIELPLGNLPAVQNATMSVGAARSPEGVWSFTGTGTATLAVPGATGTLTIAYDDGVVTLTGVGTVERGPASGTLNFTATNGAIDEEGNPIEGEIGNSITAWGRGSVSIQFGSIITGTEGIEYTQDNRVIISGEIAMPPTYEVFARREYTRDLLHIEPPEFPIWGVSVAGVGVGIFAFVDARISFNAYVGPGEIRDASISATMDLDHPEDATIHGEGQFFVPAYAGLNLNVGGGLRARIAVAYAQGRVGLEGQLGIEADASASVDIDWNRTDGLSIEADFEANARPKFRLLANASVTVGVDLLVTDVSHTFGPWERTLGEFGPDMELGVDFPVRWSEADGLDLSLDNMTIRQPSLDASALMSSVFDRLA